MEHTGPAAKKVFRAPRLKQLATEEPKREKEVDYKYDPRPELTFTTDEIPAISDWKIGKKYKITAEIEMKSIHKGENGKENSARFKVVSVGAHKKD